MIGGGFVSLWKCFWQNCFWPLLLLILLGLAQMFWPGGEWRKIEKDVNLTVTESLQANGVDWAQVDTKNRGRDVLLSGSAPSEEMKNSAMRIASELSKDKRGNLVARVVEWNGSVIEPAPVAPVVEAEPEPIVEAEPEPIVEAEPEPIVEAEPEPVVEAEPEPVVEVEPEPVVEVEPEPVVPELNPGNLSFSVIDGKITLNGVVASIEEEQTLLTTATEVYGPENVVNRLTVKDNILPIENIGSLVSDFGLKDGTLRLSLEKGLKITGSDSSDQLKELIGQNLQTALGADYSVNNLLTVKFSEPVVLQAEPIENIAAICQANVRELMSESKIFFATSKVEIKPESYVLLDNIATILINDCKESIVTVAGHTDNTGSQDVNQPLSLSRAKAVMDYLIVKGVEANRLSSVGYGADKPVASNETKDGRAANRRIEFTVK